nr:TetR/AcrR family transcriptional regulator [Parahaliea mediterranea]
MKPASKPSVHDPARGAGRRSARGEAARRRLKEAATRVLDRVGFHQMRVKDVTDEAGVAAGLFYHYFKDLRELVDELLDEHIAGFEAVEAIERDVSKGDWFNRLRAHYEICVRVHAEHPGIMRCIAQFSADDPDFRERWKRSFDRRLHLLIDVFPYVFPKCSLNKAEVELLVHGLGGVGKELMSEYYIDRDPRLRAVELSQAEMAEWLAALLYRGLFARNPPAGQLRYASRILEITRE